MMTNDDALRNRVDDVARRSDRVNQAKAAVGGQLAAKKQQLAALLEEIKAAGIEPRNIMAERDKAKADLVSMLDEYETGLRQAETALAAFEGI